jgi:hypothetical protein
MIFQLRGTENHDWDRFQIRNIGFKLEGQLKPLLSLFPDWLIRAKSVAEESTYLRLMQKDKQLRQQIIELGS